MPFPPPATLWLDHSRLSLSRSFTTQCEVTFRMVPMTNSTANATHSGRLSRASGHQ